MPCGLSRTINTSAVYWLRVVPPHCGRALVLHPAMCYLLATPLRGTSNHTAGRATPTGRACWQAARRQSSGCARDARSSFSVGSVSSSVRKLLHFLRVAMTPEHTHAAQLHVPQRQSPSARRRPHGILHRHGGLCISHDCSVVAVTTHWHQCNPCEVCQISDRIISFIGTSKKKKTTQSEIHQTRVGVTDAHELLKTCSHVIENASNHDSQTRSCNVSFRQANS